MEVGKNPLCKYNSTIEQQNEENSGYIHKVSAHWAGLCIKYIKLYTSGTLSLVATLSQNQIEGLKTSELRKLQMKNPLGQLIAMT